MADNPYTPMKSEPIKASSKTKPYLGLSILAVLAIGFVFLGLLVPSRRRGGREPAFRMQCSNNLKQIALALLNYEFTHHQLPPAYTVDTEGRPLHSWRTLILPYLERVDLYEQVDLTKPWDDPVNDLVRESNIPVFRCNAANLKPGLTTYMTVLSEGSCLRPAHGRRLADIEDKSETLLVIESDSVHSAHWMSPVDVDLQVFLQADPKRKTSHVGGRNACMVDGSYRFLAKDGFQEELTSKVNIDKR